MGSAERIFKGMSPVWKTGVMSRCCPQKAQRGRLTSYTVKSRDGDATTGFVVNTLGEITGITATLPGQAAQSIASNISYQPFGGLKALTWGNGLTLERSFDNDYRLSSQSISGSQSIQSLSYQYDPISNITAINDSVDISNTGSYEYDLINRLSNESKSDYQNSFSYDAVGNRTGQTQVDLVTGATDTQSHTYGTANNRLITRNAVSQSYDEVGNILNNGTTTFSYDVSNRMADASQGGTILASYTYNALGQRSSKTRLNSSNAHSTAYIYNPAGQLISETTYNNAGIAQETKHYLWLGTVPIAMLQPAANDADQKVIYLHTDHLDTPRKATDQNQQVVWQWHSDAFGSTAANDDVDNNGINTTINLRFPGQYLDQETGLHYNYFRDYDPEIGRYVQSDPIGLDGGINTYTYVQSNPVAAVDYHGLFISEIIKEIISATGCHYIGSKYDDWNKDINDVRDYRLRLEREQDQAFYENCFNKFDTPCERRKCWEGSPYRTDRKMDEIIIDARESRDRNPWRHLNSVCDNSSLLQKKPKKPNGGDNI